MARDPIHRAGGFETENSGGALAGLFADEDDFDRRSLLRLATWGAVAVSAVAVALYTSQSSIGLRQEQVAAADLARQEQQIRSIAKEGQNETRRLASAIDTLNGDRDRLYSRVTVLEQGLDSVTGSIARQKAVVAAAPPPPVPAPAAVATAAPAAPPNSSPAPATAIGTAAAEKPAEKPVADASPPRPNPTAPASVEQGTPNKPAAPAAGSSMAPKSIMAAPDAAAGKSATPEPAANAAATAAPTPSPAVVAAVPAVDKPDTPKVDATLPMPPKVEVQKTEFAVDVGGANSVGGLRALWRGLLKSRSNAPLAALHPIIMIKESDSGPGMQLRLGAGPLSDAAAAAKICAVMVENRRPCETSVYDGQRLAMTPEDASAPTAAAKPGSARPAPHRRSSAKRVTVEEPPPPPPEPTTLSTIFGRR
ncbi:MAG TPA: hypothetical protein VGM09_31455 [Bradyrhizobium sp.]|jgi:hypothetical protein